MLDNPADLTKVIEGLTATRVVELSLLEMEERINICGVAFATTDLTRGVGRITPNDLALKYACKQILNPNELQSALDMVVR